MALVDIITLIEREAAEKAESLVEGAKAEAVSLVEAATSEAGEAVAALEKDAEATRSALSQRKKSEFARNDRVAVSVAQQQVVDSVFSAVYDEFQSLSGDDLTAVFSTLLLKIPSDDGEVVVCAGKKAELEDAVKATKKNFRVSENLNDCGGGFMYKGDGFEMDFSFSALIEKELRPAKEGEIFKELF